MPDLDLTQPIAVLNNGYVKHIDHMGTDETVIEAARMSVGKGFISWEPYEGAKRGDLGLLEYLYKNKHMTPFEMCEIAIEVQAPLFVVGQWERHRTQSYNQHSGRYSEMPNMFYVPEIEHIKAQGKINKQGSEGEISLANKQHFIALIENDQCNIRDHYEHSLSLNISKELARINLPLAQFTKFRAKANLRNWLSFLMLRKAPEAQYEIRVYADIVGQIIEQLYPRTYALFLEHDFNAIKLSATERKLLNEFINKGTPFTKDWETLKRKING